MREEKKPFEFLDHGQFSALTGKEKAEYLTIAARELEMRQRKLREEMQELRARTRHAAWTCQ